MLKFRDKSCFVSKTVVITLDRQQGWQVSFRRRRRQQDQARAGREDDRHVRVARVQAEEEQQQQQERRLSVGGVPSQRRDFNDVNDDDDVVNGRASQDEAQPSTQTRKEGPQEQEQGQGQEGIPGEHCPWGLLQEDLRVTLSRGISFNLKGE